MSDGTRVDWATASINPIGWGCFGPGGTAENPRRCPYCYAKRMADRHLRACPECNNFVPHWHEEEMEKPLHWKGPRRIFVESMGDLFGISVSRVATERVIALCDLATQHQYLVLTKEAKLMYERLAYWPTLPPNLWCGVSVTNQTDADERIPWLLEIPAGIRWVSLEPLCAPVKLGYFLQGIFYHTLDWVVIGGETGNRKGKVTPKREWIEDIVEQCQSAGVAVFLKQNLRSIAGAGNLIQEYPSC